MFDIYQIIPRLLVAFLLLPVHEFAHAWAARKLGDETANYSGRLTLNPLAHLDPIGTILLILTGYGWAKPVPINPRNFKNQKVGMGLSALAGPVSNVIMAYILLLVCKILTLIPITSVDMNNIINPAFDILNYMAVISVGLAVFNFIPVPPLDGSRVLGMILPDRVYFKVMQYDRYIYIGLMIILFAGVLDTPLYYARTFIYGLLWTLAGLGA